jgi:hypothetical protein
MAAHQQRGQDAGGHSDPAAGIAAGFEQVAQFADVTRGVVVFQAKVGQQALGSAFGGTVEQFVELLAAQEQQGLDEHRLLFGLAVDPPALWGEPRERVGL